MVALERDAERGESVFLHVHKGVNFSPVSGFAESVMDFGALLFFLKKISILVVCPNYPLSPLPLAVEAVH